MAAYSVIIANAELRLAKIKRTTKTERINIREVREAPALKEKNSCEINTSMSELSNNEDNEVRESVTTAATQNTAQEIRPQKRENG